MMTFLENDTLVLERALLGDKIYIMASQVRALSGAPDPQTPPGQVPMMVEGACTVYLEGELGFTVNHTQEEVLDMIRAARVTN